MHHPTHREPDHPWDVVKRRSVGQRETTRPLSRALSRNEPTPADLERFVRGERGSVLIAGRYQLERPLGRGGMARVFAARDLTLDCPVALKILAEKYVAMPQVLARFLREARYIAQLRHPNVVELVNFGSTDSGVVYIAMELLEGEDLDQILARECYLPWPRALPLMLDICAGLAAVHRQGIIHRDLKPSNCFCVQSPEREMIRLVDFGIATQHDLLGQDVDERLTELNTIVGTPDYMSPEQARGERVDHRSDIYAAGVILGEMLTGSLPFEPVHPTEMAAAHIYEESPRLSDLAPADVDIPPGLDAIYARALAKDPARRFPTMGALAAALRGLELDRDAFENPVSPSTQRPWLRASASAALVFDLEREDQE